MALPTDSDFMSGMFKGRSMVALGIVLSGVATSIIFFSARSCSRPDHMEAAYENFQKGDWQGALEEATLQLDVEPDNPEALVMVADAHAALADETRGNFDVYVRHVCAAIHYYQLRLDRGYISPIATKKAIFEERNQEMYSPEGKYVGCNDGAVESPTE